MKLFIPEIVITILLVAVVGLLWNPYWMPMGLQFVALICFVVLVGIFVAFVWREKGGDERDVLLRHVASRFAYLAGTLILGIGIVFESLTAHMVDKWLLLGFIFSIIAKAIGSVYGKKKY